MSVQDGFRDRATELRGAANALIENGKLLKDPSRVEFFDAKNLVTAIVGHVTANVLEAQADTLDILRVTSGEDSMVERRREMLARNDAIRKAAARGDWDEFDRLTGIAAGDPGSRT